MMLPAAILVPAGVRERHNCWLSEGLVNIVVTSSLDLNGHISRQGPNSEMAPCPVAIVGAMISRRSRGLAGGRGL